MFYKLTLVVAMIALCMASPKVSLNKNLKTSLHKIASHYGMSSMESMKLVSLTDPKSQILDQLNDLLTQLRTEQNEALVQHLIFLASKAQERANLKDTLDSVQGQVQDIQNQIDMSQGNIGSITSQETDLQNQANEADSQVKLYEALLDRLNQDHHAAAAKYADIIKQHDDAMATLQQLIDMVSNFQFNEALAMLNKQRHNFLHRKHGRVALLVQASIQLIQKKGPKNEIKQKLLDLLNQIQQGTADSRALYVQEANNEVDQFNEQSASLSQMITNFKDQRDLALAQLAELMAQKSNEKDNLDQAQGTLDNLQDSIATIGDALAALDAEVANETDEFNKQSQDRVDDMNAIEAAIQYVNDHVQGMSVHDLCHIGAPGCYRCLTSSDCDNGEQCSDDGKCQAKPKPVVIGDTVNEHDTLKLICPGTSIIGEVKFASYGMPTGEFPDFTRSDWCDAPSSMGIVSSLCQGQHSCSVPADNGVFGDPCGGTFKHMSVVAVCF